MEGREPPSPQSAHPTSSRQSGADQPTEAYSNAPRPLFPPLDLPPEFLDQLRTDKRLQQYLLNCVRTYSLHSVPPGGNAIEIGAWSSKPCPAPVIKSSEDYAANQAYENPCFQPAPGSKACVDRTRSNTTYLGPLQSSNNTGPKKHATLRELVADSDPMTARQLSMNCTYAGVIGDGRKEWQCPGPRSRRYFGEVGNYYTGKSMVVELRPVHDPRKLGAPLVLGSTVLPPAHGRFCEDDAEIAKWGYHTQVMPQGSSSSLHSYIRYERDKSYYQLVEPPDGPPKPYLPMGERLPEDCYPDLDDD